MLNKAASVASKTLILDALGKELHAMGFISGFAFWNRMPLQFDSFVCREIFHIFIHNVYHDCDFSTKN